MKAIKRMTGTELAAYVATRLRDDGIEVVLSGGACVSLYSNRKYVSMDLDLVNIRFAQRGRIREVMKGLGFLEEHRYFKHADTDFLVEFPPGPLVVGQEPIKQVDELTVETGTLKILSPTDCIKDRLAWFYFAGDKQSLEQAVLVAQDQIFDIKEIERWSRAEGKLQEFRAIQHRFTQTGAKGEQK